MSKKSESGAKTYDYYGALIAAVCRGPVDTLHSIMVDGKEIFTGPLSRGTADATDITATITAADGKWIHSKGKAVIFWGTGAQDISASFLTGHQFDSHPDYLGVCVLAFTGLLFGRERTTAPNIEVVVSRKPVVSTSLVATLDNVLDDGQANPVACLVELLQADAKVPSAAFEESEWLAAGAYCAANKGRYFCSPLLTQQVSARDAIADLLRMFDGALYWTPAGKIGVRLLKPGVNPGGLATLDAATLAEMATLTGAGWPDVPTTVIARYQDRDASYKAREAKGDNMLALRNRGTPKTTTIELPHVTRANQAAAIAADVLRRSARPMGTISLSVRRPHAANLTPGAKVLVDTDPEPGGSGLAQLCIVDTRQEDATGPVELRVIPDTLAAAIPYSPTFVAPNPQAADCPDLDPDEGLVIPLSPTGWGKVGAVSVLIPRPDETVTGFRTFFDDDSDTGDADQWADLEFQPGFACRVTLEDDVAEDGTVFKLELSAGSDGPDAYLATRLPDNDLDAQLDKLLLVVANLDENGIVKVTDGVPEVEICSVVSRVAVSGAIHNYTVLRARKGTVSRAWVSTDAPKCYVLPADNVTPLEHPSVKAMLAGGSVGYLRLRAFTAEAEADPVELSFAGATGYNPLPRITWTTPATGQGEADGSGVYTPSVAVDDSDGDLVSVVVSTSKSDGTGYTEHSRQTFAKSSSKAFTSSITLPSNGTHVLTITATDAAGNTTTSSVTILFPAASGPQPPTFSPQGFDYSGSSVTVTLTVVSPCDQVQWVVGAIGSSAPSAWPNETAVNTLTKSVTLTGKKRLWARGKQSTGPVYSDPTYHDYEPYSLD